MGRKPRRIILPHLGLVTFRCHVGRTRPPTMFMFFGPMGRDHDSQKQLSVTLETRQLQTNKEKTEPFSKAIWENLEVLEIEHFKNEGKDEDQNIPEIYVYPKHKRTCSNMGSISITKHESEIC